MLRKATFHGTPERISQPLSFPGMVLYCLLCVLSGTFHEAHEALALGVKGYMKELSVRVVRVAGKGYVTIT